MPEPLSEPHLRAWRALLGAQSRALAAIERDLATAGSLPLLWYDVLYALHEAPARHLRMHELADAVVLSRSGLTRLVDRLDRDGLLAREPCPEDRRGQHAVLTEAGLAALRSGWPAYRAGIARHFARHLCGDEAGVLAAALERIADPPTEDAE